MGKQISYKKIESLENITVIDKIACENYTFYETLKTKRFLKSPIIHKNVFLYCEYIYDDEYKYMLTADQILSKDYLIENNTVFFKPYVQLNFKCASSIKKTFNTFEDAVTWAREIIEVNKLEKTFMKII